MGTLNSIFMGIAGLIEPKFIGANLQGCAFSALVVSLLRLICLLSFDSSIEINYFYSTILYFALNVLILIIMTMTLPVRYETVHSSFFLNHIFSLLMYETDNVIRKYNAVYLVLPELNLCLILSQQEKEQFKHSQYIK